MIYIVVALKAEAQAFIDKFRLKKSQLATFTTLYENENMRLIISGLGVANARVATQNLINQYDITDDDIYLNVGICGASEAYALGSLVEIGSVIYKEIAYSFDTSKESIVCVDAAVSHHEHKIVDMESYGFYDAVVHNPAIKHFHIFKVVSDHFEPERVTKDGTKKLIFNAIESILSLTKKS